MAKQVVVTGASGYIGRHLTKLLMKEGFHVNIIARENSDLSFLPDNDKTISVTYYDGNLSSLEPAFADKGIEAVFHLAAWSKLTHKNSDIDTIIDSNIRLGMHLLESATKHKCPSFINTGSFSSFNNSSDYQPQSLYSASKRAFEDIIEYYAYSGQLNAITLILSDVYGNNDNRKKIFSLLKEACMNQTELETTAGEQLICPVFIDDITNAYKIAYEQLYSDKLKGYHKKFFISGEKIKLKDMIKKYVIFAGYDIEKINMGALPYPSKQIMDPFIGDILPGWEPSISIDEGLKKIING